ncbi:MAG: protein translocase subunit SecF [Oscillospiraceae bacterium]|nr:protein translocase subunit SecF [Oscillospiraceae bacterium]
MSKSNNKNNSSNVQSVLQDLKVRDFYGNRKKFFVLSSVLVVVIMLFCFIRGVQVSIEFKGGTLAEYSYSGSVNENDIAALAKDYLNTPVKVQLGETFTGEKQTTFTLSFSMEKSFSAEMQDALLKKLQEKYPDSKIDALETNDVAAKSGKQFLAKCSVAAIFASVVLILYIAWRFKRISGWSAGIFAVVALFHDLAIVFGTFVVCGFEIDSNFMAVILTILGYSVNDTIVIYDRIRENQALLPANTKLPELVNISLSQTIRRTVRTSITTITAMLIITILAAVNHVDSILRFSIPMTVGMISGCYSSLGLAPMLWTAWKTREKKEKAE